MRYSAVRFLLLGTVLFIVAFPFLSNTYIFDDYYVFSDVGVSNAAHMSMLSPRWWVYTLYTSLYVQGDAYPLWLRVLNLSAHFSVAIVLFIFLRVLMTDFRSEGDGRSADGVAFAVAAIFALHPLAVYTQSYLVQCSILFSSLFGLLSLLCFWRGMRNGGLALWGALLFFVLAIYSKEHVVMLPVVASLLIVLYWRSGFRFGGGISQVVLVLFLQLLVALAVTLSFKWLLVSPYEQATGEVLEGELSLPGSWLYPLSVLNQAGLFFKYLGLWLMPNPMWLSIDMREPFPSGFSEPGLWIGALAYISYCLVGLRLVWVGGRKGLIGFGLLAPAIMFVTEFSTVRLQECFVLYRSYLWVFGIFLLLALALQKLRTRVVVVTSVALFVLFTGLSIDRLSVMARPLLAWGEAKELMERREPVPTALGAYRIYYNVGVTLSGAGRSDEAIKNYDQTLSRKPSYVPALLNRGILLLERKQWMAAYKDFDVAVSNMPQFTKPYIGRGRALQGLGRIDEARKDLEQACSMGATGICKELSLGVEGGK
ncbi:tetratricopeptide repeat protein [Pseudomonas tohonis]|nr:hypothetical protein L682_24755 [Pseudomonas alcaligenes OT 69]MDN4146224.1 tetratricopeptide repeat protein [Pseudomonas tohonis]